MPKKTRVAVLYGGHSGEHEVSLTSSKSIIAGLEEAGFAVTPVLVPKDGAWPVAKVAALKSKVDVIFPIIHGTGGEDGAVQGLLDLAGIPYVGSGVLGSAVNMDKVTQKQLFAQQGFPIAPYVHFKAHEWNASQSHREALVATVEANLAYPCFIKPANLGSSVGVNKAHHRIELYAAVEDALQYDTKVVVEMGVPEAREIETAVLGLHEPTVSVCGEVVPSNEFYDYAAKYVDGKSVEHIPADLPPAVADRIREMAAKAFKALDCAGLARIDFFVAKRSGDVFINEINTLPGFTPVSMYPKMWAASGLPYPKLLSELVSLALQRDAERKALRRDFAVPSPTDTDAPEPTKYVKGTI